MTSRPGPRVAVYAIALDEADNVEGWVAAAAAADAVIIGDTGSRDDTVERTTACGATAHSMVVDPFRFDVARNLALDAVPADIDVCISVDLDERLHPRWREELDKAWQESDPGLWGARLSWTWHPQVPPRSWTVWRIHPRHGYRWQGPVHERLERRLPGPARGMHTGITIEHLRDPDEPRPDYLPLLRLAVAERPTEAYWTHLLALECFGYGLVDEALQLLDTVLTLPGSGTERLHSFLTLAQHHPQRRGDLIVSACSEFSTRAEPWRDLAQWHLDEGRGGLAARAITRARLAVADPDDYLADLGALDPPLP